MFFGVLANKRDVLNELRLQSGENLCGELINATS